MPRVQTVLERLRLSLSLAGGRPLPEGVGNPALADVISRPSVGRTEAFVLAEGPDQLEDLDRRAALAREAAVDLWLVWFGADRRDGDSLMTALQLAAECRVGVATLRGPLLLRVRPPEIVSL